MRMFVVLVMGLLVGGHAQAAEAWSLVGVYSGVTVERKNMAGSDLFAFRGEGVFAAPIGLLVTVLKEPSIATEWVDLMTEHTVLRTVAEHKNLIYESYALPWPISDRDYVMFELCGYDPVQKVFTIDYESVEDAAKPPDSGHVRAVAFRTFWRLDKIDDTHTKIVVEVFTDPKGLLPSWLINIIQKDWPWQTITGLVKRANQGDLKTDPMLVEW